MRGMRERQRARGVRGGVLPIWRRSPCSRGRAHTTRTPAQASARRQCVNAAGPAKPQCTGLVHGVCDSSGRAGGRERCGGIREEGRRIGIKRAKGYAPGQRMAHVQPGRGRSERGWRVNGCKTNRRHGLLIKVKLGPLKPMLLYQTGFNTRTEITASWPPIFAAVGTHRKIAVFLERVLWLALGTFNPEGTYSKLESLKRPRDRASHPSSSVIRRSMSTSWLVVRALSFVSSAVADIVISAARYYYLRELKRGYIQCVTLAARTTPFKVNFVVDRTREVVDTVVLAMHTNFVWIGLFFNLAPLFANSILATLNLRNWYRHMHRPMGISLTRNTAPKSRFAPMSPRAEITSNHSEVANIVGLRFKSKLQH
ncbi:hypothetical protein DFH09DRAFT_1094915 [Mycena vulgaris]|nr:hypothetical protein DFH09DRAFT_1094915 [Mycena vulgaris]